MSYLNKCLSVYLDLKVLRVDLSGFGAYRSSCIHINADDPETHKLYSDGDLHCLGEYVLLTELNWLD